MNNYPLFELQDITLATSFSDRHLLKNISFSVFSGEKIAITGASGAGKTSLLKVCNLLLSPTEGQITFTENDLNPELITKLRQQIALVPQEPKLLGMTVQEALVYPLKLQKLTTVEITQRIAIWSAALKIPDLWLERQELQLSLGQRQLVAIARALVMQPTILLLDEPTSALDVGTSNLILSVINSLVENHNLTVLMVNHQLEFSAQFAERILYLENGTLIEDTIANTNKWQQIKEKLLKRIEN